MREPVRIKPHHFVDIITALGRGRLQLAPHARGHALHIVARRILTDPEAVLRIELGADDVCGPCRHNIDGACDDTIDTSSRPAAPQSKNEWNLLIDRRWCERLKLGQHDQLTARELCERIRDLAGDMTDIYREIPAECTADRRDNLEKGIRKFLQAEGKSNGTTTG